MKIEFGCTSSTYYWIRRIKENHLRLHISSSWNASRCVDIIPNVTCNNVKAAPSIQNASFIHGISDSNIPFALNSQTLNRICSIDTALNSVNSHIKFVCFWCINNFRHARLPACLLHFISMHVVFVVHSVVTLPCVSLQMHFHFASENPYVDSKHYDTDSIIYWFWARKVDIERCDLVSGALQLCVNCFLD